MTEGDRIALKARKGRRLLAATGAVIAVVAVGLAVYAIYVNVGQTKDITKIEKSACAKDVHSKECRKLGREVARAKSIADTCIAFWKVGYACPNPNSKRTPSQPNSLEQGGDASQPAQAGQPPKPAPAGGSQPQGTHHGEQGSPTAPGTPAPVPPSAEPPPAPGNSGANPGGENGVKACVDLVVSACVKTDLP